MSTAPVELSDVLSYVLERADETDLDRIAQAINRRRLELQENASAAVTINATVTIRDVTPTYLIGLSGVVKAITPGHVQYVTLALDEVSKNRLAGSSRTYAHLAGRDSYDLAGVPLGCCRVTNS